MGWAGRPGGQGLLPGVTLPPLAPPGELTGKLAWWVPPPPSFPGCRNPKGRCPSAGDEASQPRVGGRARVGSAVGRTGRCSQKRFESWAGDLHAREQRALPSRRLNLPGLTQPLPGMGGGGPSGQGAGCEGRGPGRGASPPPLWPPEGPGRGSGEGSLHFIERPRCAGHRAGRCTYMMESSQQPCEVGVYKTPH